MMRGTRRPVAPVLALEANVATEVGGIVLPRGSVVSLVMPPSALDERRFPRAHAFEVGPSGDRRKVTENYALTMFPKNLRLRLLARAPGP